MKIIQTYKADLLNGEGLRNVYFPSGCEHHCPGCFNSETWDPDMPGAREWTREDMDKLLEDAEKSYIQGISFLGGDPFHPVNREEILKICKEFKEHFGNTKDIWLWTGNTWEQIEKIKDTRWECLKYIDVLCDGPYIDHLKSPGKPWVGSENQRVIDVQRSLKEGKIVLR